VNQLRIAVIGAGHLGRIHAKLLGQVEGARLVAISDPVEQARCKAAELFDVPTYADYRDLVSDIDAAVIAAPTDAHAEIAGQLLKAGKHVLVEKPLTIDRTDANALSMLASSKKLTLQVGHGSIRHSRPSINWRLMSSSLKQFARQAFQGVVWTWESSWI
jgi:predicted dehydrogenase